jgi:N-acetyl-anhydromuramyl-L-alanine amidase AmpD
VSPPPAPGFPDEPDLKPAGGGDSKVPPLNGPSAGGGTTRGGSPGSITPGASLDPNTTRARRSEVQPRQASLAESLRPYVNDPDVLFSPPKADRPWKYIVLHHSASAAGGLDSIDAEHRKRLGFAGCGYHFVIGNGTESPDGQIEVARRWTDQKHGVHCRDGKDADVNEYGIGICLVGDLDQSPPTPRQVAAARALVAYLETRYQISASHAETHAHVAASPTACPGRLFPAQKILRESGVALLKD